MSRPSQDTVIVPAGCRPMSMVRTCVVWPVGAMRTCTRAGAESAKDTVCLVKSGLTVKREKDAGPSKGPAGVAVAVAIGAAVTVIAAVGATVGLSGIVAVVVAVVVTAGAAPTVAVAGTVAVAASVGVLLGGSGVAESVADGDGGTGLLVAESVAAMVGDNVGLLVEVSVGVADGAAVGLAVSASVGVALGLGDGRGVAVCATVGDAAATVVDEGARPICAVAMLDGDGWVDTPIAPERCACSL